MVIDGGKIRKRSKKASKVYRETYGHMARTGAAKATIRARIQSQFGYDLAGTVETIRPGYAFDVSCQGAVPAALIAFLDADSYEDIVRNAVSLGGDTDTLACIAGSIAEAFYGGVPDLIRAEIRVRLTLDLWRVVEAFEHRYPVGAVRC